MDHHGISVNHAGSFRHPTAEASQTAPVRIFAGLPQLRHRHHQDHRHSGVLSAVATHVDKWLKSKVLSQETSGRVSDNQGLFRTRLSVFLLRNLAALVLDSRVTKTKVGGHFATLLLHLSLLASHDVLPILLAKAHPAADLSGLIPRHVLCHKYRHHLTVDVGTGINLLPSITVFTGQW